MTSIQAFNSPSETLAWQQANHRCLMTAITAMQQRLQAQISGEDNGRMETSVEEDAWQAIATQMDHPPALLKLAQRFKLTPFERDILVLCAGIEFGGDWSNLCATAQNNSRLPFPTFELAQSILPAPHWSAFLPSAPLRRWHLIDMGPGNALLSTPLRLDERILHELLGFNHLDDRLESLVTEIGITDYLVESHQQIVDQLTAAWQDSAASSYLPIMQLCGSDRRSQQAIAVAAASALGYRLFALSSRALPTNPQDVYQFIRLWEREVVLSDVALLLDWEQLAGGDAARENAVTLVSEAIASPLLMLSRERRPFSHRPVMTYTVQNPSRSEQIQLWQNHFYAETTELQSFVDTITNQFDLTTNQIQAASMQARTLSHAADSAPHQYLWETCRLQARPRLDDLAQRLNPKETWDDLVLPDAQKQTLREIVAHVEQRSQVYNTWGFAQKSSRGLGISALFAGTSGTGKTMAAGVLAQTLQLDLYRIDLSSVVSKYIGETEKNLRRVFDAADSGGVILLFDEADALFGKRSDVKDSHDRYANMEVSYLLQRMEAYRGLAILTTNLKDAIDPAFLRRIRFIVRFPFPDYEQRIEIWQHIFPVAVPTQDLNYRQLAKLNVAGGMIRNIALSAAFLAASDRTSVTMGHLLNAAQREFTKLERPLPVAEVKGWNR
jgi:ATP-dependent 26S proteasome regulatory subunit